MPAVSKHPLEIRVTRAVGDGFHEDIDITNYTAEQLTFLFAIEIDADFADQAETRKRKQTGKLERTWDESLARLTFDYSAEHSYENQSERGLASIRRCSTIDLRKSSSSARLEGQQLRFEISLDPHESWHTCVLVTASIDGVLAGSPPDCFAGKTPHAEQTSQFFVDSTRFQAPGSTTLTPLVLGALEQARRDLSAMRLFDLDSGSRSWTLAAGLPLYVALFGRDTLTAGWQAGLLART